MGGETARRQGSNRRQADRPDNARPGDFTRVYAPPAGVFDEMTDPSMGVRAHWQGFARIFDRLSLDEVGQRWELGQGLLRDNGVTYNVHGDPAGLERPWHLDPLPLLITKNEWDGITQAVTQRAHLLDRILSDLYGPRRLLADGILPPSVLHANPSFLRPCHGWLPAGGRYLHYYAADLMRGPDGHWQVLADRTESPAGAGYALENRTIVNRVLPDFFRAVHVERLGPFFDILRRSLQALAPRRADEPRMVLLTPGPYNETYFEHAFLARHLGIPLIQGEDLTVRDNCVYVKTLTGLQPVDVILRRTGGEWCDPLELRGDSTLGVAGLVQAARAGNVAICNALGAGLLDGAAIKEFLPTISRYFLGTDLLMHSVPSWWCGTQGGLAHVQGNLHRMMLRPAFHNRRKTIFGADLPPDEYQKLLTTITRRPWEWVGQDVAPLSSVPVWENGALVPRHMLLRVFAVATDQGDWQVMHGGLARVSSEHDLLTSRLQTSGSGGSKDVWVLSDAPPLQAPGARGPSAPPVKLTRGYRDLPSRVADNMFWLGRYLERAESTTRLLRSALSRLEEAIDQGDNARTVYTARTMARLGLALPPQALQLSGVDLVARLVAHHADPQANGLAGAAERLLRTVANLRDRLSVDTWRALQRLRTQVEKLGREKRGDVSRRLNTLVLTAEAVSGLSMENMTRGPLWLFLEAGRRIERANTIIDTLGGALGEAENEDSVPMDLLLELWDSVMTYRSRYLASPRLAAVLDLLLCDESNPRSLGFQFLQLSHHMDALAQHAGENGFLRPEQRVMTVLCGTVRTTDAIALSHYDPDIGYRDAERLLENLRSRLWELSEVISREFFSHAQWRLPTPPMDLLP